ncbi:MAG: UDP-N-acetylenolpyruvoylglucosamine reductase [marine bacterium B5-7]|nr:MAG: UDP-N-acetylenolpyruvoylglucosamine reductase [marine bacterium B5-7]
MKNAQLQTNCSLAGFTTWGVGGPADYVLVPRSLEELSEALQETPADMPITWLGLGSNVLIRDAGIRGLVILTHKGLSAMTETASGIHVEAGVPCAKLAKWGAKHDKPDAAFFAGIPGTIGGALFMNAGAFGHETWKFVNTVDTINRRGEISHYPANHFNAEYRHIIGLGQDEWFVAGDFQFETNTSAEAKTAIKALLQKRNDAQPIGLRSCGSVFRNPPGDYAARLIEACGLKGKTLGGAQVSEKHANFIINTGAALAADIESLIHMVQDTVKQETGIHLQAEAKILGEAT